MNNLSLKLNQLVAEKPEEGGSEKSRTLMSALYDKNNYTAINK